VTSLMTFADDVALGDVSQEGAVVLVMGQTAISLSYPLLSSLHLLECTLLLLQNRVTFS
jgi:hypothetical protein